jgi:hypothetical protein
MVDAIHRRFPGTAADAVAAAIEAAGLTQCGLARFVNRLQGPAGAEWPKAAMTGEAAYRVAVALHEAGILDRVPPCTHCGRSRMVNSRGSASPTCGACGPRNADGTKARSTDPEKSMCPAGLHRVPAYTLRCDACVDEADTALIQDAILQVGPVPSWRGRSSRMCFSAGCPGGGSRNGCVPAGRLIRATRRRHWFSGFGTPLPLSCRTSPGPAVLTAEASVGSFPIRVRTAVSARTATAGRREGSRPAGPAGRSATSPGATMMAGPGAPRAVAVIPMS